MTTPRSLVLLILLTTLLIVPWPKTMRAAEDNPNSCLTCHNGMKRHKLKQCYAEWQGSIHARQHVSCEDCHGGNPGATDKENAHQGVFSAMNPKSAVYYTRIPGLCGGCHKVELKDFQATKHYQSLMDKGMGPHCITCHDSMSTKVLTPDEIESLCTICHNARNKNLPHVSGLAKNILERMLLMDQKIAQTENTLAIANKDSAANSDNARNLLKLATQKLRACKRQWHSFRFERMDVLLDETDGLLKNSQDTLEHTAPRAR